MAKIFKIEIQNFRGIQNLVWFPAPGMNCLIGKGDSGKSTILDAIDLCLEARRYVQFSDVDFYALDVTKPIKISITLVDLDAPLKNIESYRPEILRHCRKALSLAVEGSMTFEDASVSIREQNRYVGRPMSRRSVGSTLLLKGLEADIAVVLNPEEMNANHLYVALTRGARQLVVYSSTPILRPKAKSLD